MRYVVGIVSSSLSSEADLKGIVRDSDIEAAISTFMRAKDLHHAYGGYAYPVKERHQGPSPIHWRKNIRCSVTGKITMSPGIPGEESKNVS